jgi:hypothetical protein
MIEQWGSRLILAVVLGAAWVAPAQAAADPSSPAKPPPAAAPATLPQGTRLRGVVASVDAAASRLMLTTAEGVQHTVRITPGTVTKPAGTRLQLAELKPGQMVLIQGRTEPGGVFLAESLSVARPVPTPTFAPPPEKPARPASPAKKQP